MNLFIFETAGGLRAYWRSNHETVKAAWKAIQRELNGNAIVVFVERLK